MSGGEFFARVTYRVINGEPPREAIENVAVTMSGFIQMKVTQAIKKVQEEADENSSLHNEQFSDDIAFTSMAKLWDVGRSEPIRVGKTSPTEGTLPGSIYFILKYLDTEDGLNIALAANAMVLGAYFGVDAIKKEWLDTLEQYEYCEELLNRLPLLKD